MCYELFSPKSQGNSVFLPRKEIEVPERTGNKDLVVAQKLKWIYTLTRTLTGVKFNFIPVTYAAPPPPPEKPKPMKYTDLSIYESPYSKYQDYVEEKEASKCPGKNKKIIHEWLYPHVKSIRLRLRTSVFGMTDEIVILKNEIAGFLCREKNRYIACLRCPNNVALRQQIVAATTLTGLYLGSGSRSIMKKLFFTTAGALIGGALCFPEDTDEIVRDTGYIVFNFALDLYNSVCRKNCQMRERLPCPDELECLKKRQDTIAKKNPKK